VRWLDVDGAIGFSFVAGILAQLGSRWWAWVGAWSDAVVILLGLNPHPTRRRVRHPKRELGAVVLVVGVQ